MDLLFTRWINGLATRSPVLDAVGIFAATTLIAFLAVGALLSVVFAKAHGRRRFAAEILGTVIVAYAAAQLIGLAAFRPRPFVVRPETHQLITKAATSKSFPSDHATLAFAMAIPIASGWRWTMRSRWASLALLLLAVSIAMGRVFVGVHYVSDVLAGAFLAWGSCMFVRSLAAR